MGRVLSGKTWEPRVEPSIRRGEVAGRPERHVSWVVHKIGEMTDDDSVSWGCRDTLLARSGALKDNAATRRTSEAILGFAIAAYAVVIGSLVAYGVWVQLQRKSARKVLSPDDPGSRD